MVDAGAGVAVPIAASPAGGAVVEAHVAPVLVYVAAAGLLVQAVDVHGRHPVQPSLPFQAGEEPVGGVRPDTRLEERLPVEPVERFGVTSDERGVEHAEHPATEPLGLENPGYAGEVGDAGIRRRTRARERRDMTALTHQPGELADRPAVGVAVSRRRAPGPPGRRPRGRRRRR